MSIMLLPVFLAVAGAILMLILAPAKPTVMAIAVTAFTAGMWALAFLFAHTILRLWR